MMSATIFSIGIKITVVTGDGRNYVNDNREKVLKIGLFHGYH